MTQDALRAEVPMAEITGVAQQTRPIVAAVIAAALPLLAPALAMVLMTVGLECAKVKMSCLVGAWWAGGWGMYLVAASLSVIAIVSGVIAFLAVFRGSSSLLVAAPLTAVVIAVGSEMSLRFGLRLGAEAVRSVSPEDKKIIMISSLSESLHTSLFGFAGSASLWALLCLICVIAFLAQTGAPRRVMGLMGAVFLSLSAASLISMIRLGKLIRVSEVFGNIMPADRHWVAVDAIEEVGNMVGLPIAIALLVVIVAFAAVQLSSMPRLRILLPLLGLTGLWGHGAFAFTVHRATILIDELFPEEPLGLIAFNGRSAILPNPVACLDKSGIASCDDHSAMSVKALEEKLSANGAKRNDWVSLGVFPDASPEALWAFADTALSMGWSGLELVGESSTLDPQPIGEFMLLAQLLRGGRFGLELGMVKETCDGHCDSATVRNGKLVVGSEVWTPGVPLSATGDVLLAVDRSWTPEQLVDFGLAAASHERRLVLALGAR